MANFIQELSKISSKKDNKTPEEQILTLLFKPYEKGDSRYLKIGSLQQKIGHYQKAIKTPADKSYSKLISYFDTVATQLSLEAD